MSDRIIAELYDSTKEDDPDFVGIDYSNKLTFNFIHWSIDDCSAENSTILGGDKSSRVEIILTGWKIFHA